MVNKTFFFFALCSITFFCISCSTVRKIYGIPEPSESDAAIRKKISAAVDRATDELVKNLPAKIKIAVLSGASSSSDEETVVAYFKVQGYSDKEARMALQELPKSYVSQFAVQIKSMGTVPDNGYAVYAAEDLEYNLVKSGFRLVDRQQIESIKSEQSFQMSGDVDDNSAVSIGKMTGANAVVTISVTYSAGAGRLVLKALDVQTVEIITMARQEF